jgi:hypothetical protein
MSYDGSSNPERMEPNEMRKLLQRIAGNRTGFRLFCIAEELVAAGSAHGAAGLMTHAAQSVSGFILPPLAVAEGKNRCQQKAEGKGKGENKCDHGL